MQSLSQMLQVLVTREVHRRQKPLQFERAVQLMHAADMRRGRRLVDHPRVGGRQESVLQRVEVCHVHESFDRLAILAAHEVSLAKMAPKTCWMVRIELHRLADPVDAFLGLGPAR